MQEATERPSIVLINCDDLGYGDLGCYGSATHRTPALDALAAEGVRLTDFYVASPVCSPSRGALLTGCYPQRIGFGSFEGKVVLFPGQGVGLSTDEVTIAGLLKHRGYATCHVGKWHCGDQPEFLPTRHGFDHYYGIPYSNDMGIQAGAPAGRQWPPLPLLRDEEVIQAQPDQDAVIERYTEQSVRFIRDHTGEPFFLYLAHMQVHLPLYAPARFLRESQNGRYGACVEAIDWSTAVILRELRDLGLDANTVVIFTSDNGGRAREGGSNAPLRGGKTTTWEGGQRVPCIVRWTGRTPVGIDLSGIVSAIDLLPTLSRWAGTRGPDDRTIDGLDVGDYIVGAAEDSPRDTFFYYRANRLEAVRRGKWKLFAAHVTGGQVEQVTELYDLDADVGETTDVSGEHADTVGELAQLMEQCRRDLGDSLTGVEGANCRPIGRVDCPRPLTTYDATYPYIIAEYDLPERG
jgi:arylsulfatase A